MFVMILTNVNALKECKEVMQPSEIPCQIITSWDYPNECNTYELKVYNQIPNLVYNVSLTNYTGTDRCNQTFNCTTKGSYIFNISNGGDSGRIIVEAQDNMASLAIVVFVLAIVGSLFIVPFKTDFSKNLILNQMLKRCSWLLALFLLSLSTAMLATIADTAGIEVLKEIFRFMYLINWACYLLMVYIVLSFFFRMLKFWREVGKIKRHGEEGTTLDRLGEWDR